MKNWGRWAAPRLRPGASPLYRMMQQNADPEDAAAASNDDAPILVDPEDAILIDAVVCRATTDFERRLLRLVFVKGLPYEVVAKRLHMGRRDVPGFLRKIVRAIDSELGRTIIPVTT